MFRPNGIGCGNCGKPKASDVYDPTPKPKISPHPKIPNSSTILTTSPSNDDHRHVASRSTSGRVRGSMAVEMKSANPYEDFKHSIIQMIIHNNIYSSSDLRDLLHCFLDLNLPCHHQLILDAFTDVCHLINLLLSSPQHHPNVSVL